MHFDSMQTPFQILSQNYCNLKVADVALTLGLFLDIQKCSYQTKYRTNVLSYLYMTWM